MGNTCDWNYGTHLLWLSKRWKSTDIAAILVYGSRTNEDVWDYIKRKNKSLGYDHFCIEVGFKIFLKMFLYKDYDICQSYLYDQKYSTIGSIVNNITIENIAVIKTKHIITIKIL